MRDRIAQSDFVKLCSYAVSLTKKVLGNEKLQEVTRETTLQAAEGLSPTAVAAIPKAALRYPESRAVTWSALWRGAVTYAAPTIIYRLAIRPILMEVVADKPFYISYPVYVVDGLLANGLLVRAASNFTTDMFFYGMAIAKTTTPQPEELKHDHDSLVPCPEKCGALVNQQASIMAQVQSSAALRAVRLVDYTVSSLFLLSETPVVPILGTLVTYPLFRLIEGRILVGYKLAAVGMCEEHREEILSSNNGYCIGRGMMYWLTLRTLNNLAIVYTRHLAWKISGIDVPIQDDSNFYALMKYLSLDKAVAYSGIYNPYEYDNFVNYALSFLASLSFSVAETQANNVLPGKKRAVEVFYLPRMAVKAVMTFLVDKVALAFQPRKPVLVIKATQTQVEIEPENALALTSEINDAKDNTRAVVTYPNKLNFAWTKSIVGFYQSEFMQMLLTFVNSDLLSLDRFVQRRSVAHFLEIYKEQFHDIIDYIKSLRKGKWPKFILKNVPNAYLSDSSKAILLELRKKEWDEPVEWVENLIHRICPTEFSHLPHVASMPALQAAEAVAQREKNQEPDPENDNTFKLAKASSLPRESDETLKPATVAAEPSQTNVLPTRSALLSALLKNRIKPTVKVQDVTDEENSRMSEAASRMLGKNKED